uniref:V-SNARE coiled-coil homology domain-containing protein n=1 Tax=Maylandia zebra TaxID=106582 RepID=A0A3P9AYC8_9CICH
SPDRASHLQKTQEEVEEVKVIMLQNMNKAEERSGKLNELEDRADLLLEEVHCPSGKTSSLSQSMSKTHISAMFPMRERESGFVTPATIILKMDPCQRLLLPINWILLILHLNCLISTYWRDIS